MEKVIKIKDVASRSGFPVHAVRQAIQHGVIHAVQLGGRGSTVWVPESEVDKLRALVEGAK